MIERLKGHRSPDLIQMTPVAQVRRLGITRRSARDTGSTDRLSVMLE